MSSAAVALFGSKVDVSAWLLIAPAPANAALGRLGNVDGGVVLTLPNFSFNFEKKFGIENVSSFDSS